ncbi:MAG: phosphatidylserine decarboxylase [Salinisphaera sp.]|nr:phosphatidylserine decarboxylase [Salinisphaera sp.]
MILIVQLVILACLAVALGLCLLNFPYPSPLVRALLPAKKRWPELQIRGWLKTERFHPGYLKFFYRDPARFPAADQGILAPADGLVTSCDVREGVRYMVIALTFWDMHTQRSPMSGQVVSVDPLGDAHTDGEGRDFAFLREKFCPVQTRLVIDTDSGRVAVRLITSVAARRIETWVDPGETIERGQRIGRILLGSTVVLEMPQDWPLTVAVGARVRAGETVVANAVVAA